MKTDTMFEVRLLMCVTAIICDTDAQLSVDDIVAKAIDNGYHNLQFEKTCSTGNGDVPANDAGRVFAFIQKQKAFEEKISNAGKLYIEVNKELVKLSGLNISSLVRNSTYRQSFHLQFCRKTTLRCTDQAQARYRTADGTCNNLKYPTLGSASAIQSRYLAPVYEDGISQPRTFSVTKNRLLSPRIISNEIFMGTGPGERTPADDRLSLMTFTWGQFTDHDITLTPLSTNREGEELDCCGIDSHSEDCLPILIPLRDPHFKGRQICMSFARSIPAEAFDGCAPGHREQSNRLTSFIDAGNVYGDSLTTQALLNAPKGRLNITGKSLLPPGGICKLLSNEGDFCPLAGDERVSENPALGGMHVIWVRQHNRIASGLENITNWGSHRIFQETRKIVGALMQQITYGEYLPKILSSNTMQRYALPLQRTGFDRNYDQEIDPSIKNVFAAAAFRFGHSQIPPWLGFLFRDMASKVFKIEDTLMDPHLVVTQDGICLPDLVRFVLRNNSRKVDRQIEPGVRNKLFTDRQGLSFDLGSFNIQRGRDHGLPPYAAWRKFCGLVEPTTFEELVDHDIRTEERLSNVYERVSDIDVFVGGISELPETGSILGPLFNCLIGKQFRDLKFGDRFWYERPGNGGFTTAQLQSLRKMKLSKVICNTLNMDSIQTDAFQVPHKSNAIVRCDSLQDLDLAPWKE